MKFRLRSAHYIKDQHLPEDTLVGDGTPFPITLKDLSIEMEGIDEEGKKAEKAHNKAYMDRLSAQDAEVQVMLREAMEPRGPIDPKIPLTSNAPRPPMTNLTELGK